MNARMVKKGLLLNLLFSLSASMVAQKAETIVYVQNNTPFSLACFEVKNNQEQNSLLIAPGKKKRIAQVPRKDSNMEPIYEFSTLTKTYIRIVLPPLSNGKECQVNDASVPLNTAEVVIATENDGVGLLWNIGKAGSKSAESPLDDALFTTQSRNEYGPDNQMLSIDNANIAVEWKQLQQMDFPAYACRPTGPGSKEFDFEEIERSRFVVTAQASSSSQSEWEDVLIIVDYK